MRIFAWVALLFSAFGFFAAIMGVRDGQQYKDAVRVDGTVTGHKLDQTGGTTGGTYHDNLVGISFVNPFTKAAVEFYFENPASSMDETIAKYPVGSTHNVWVTEAGMRTCRVERPDPLNGAPMFGGVGVVFALIAAALFWFSRSS